MKKVPVAVAIVCLAFAAAVSAAPQIHVEEPTYDFGAILEGFVVTHVFVIENTGDEVLQIERVAASCGCTTTALATDSLAPGESVDLEVLIDTAGFGGRIGKSVYVYTNDPEYADSSSSDRPRFTLRVVGEVTKAQPYHTSISDMNYLFTLLVDLRDPEAYAEAHLTGAVNIPAAQLSEWTDRLPIEALIVLIDQDGTQAPAAADGLRAAGYATVFYTLGGFDEWTRWLGTFLVQTSSEEFAPASQEGHQRLVCPDRGDDPLCLDITEIRYLTYVLVDVREPAAYATSHLFGAINIPYDEISSRVDELAKDVLTIVYDQANGQSDAIAQYLINAGFTQAKSLLGGLDEWIRQYEDRFVLAAE
jgi:rhodanese-related sulfurtransferase